MIKGRRLDHIGLAVTNLEASKKWYCDVLGFEVIGHFYDGDAPAYFLKNGDTVYALVNNSYKNLGKSVQWVLDNNSDCFATKGDATTLKVGSKLLMGYK